MLFFFIGKIILEKKSHPINIVIATRRSPKRSGLLREKKPSKKDEKSFTGSS